jgi:hypothetical protein
MDEREKLARFLDPYPFEEHEPTWKQAHPDAPIWQHPDAQERSTAHHLEHLAKLRDAAFARADEILASDWLAAHDRAKAVEFVAWLDGREAFGHQVPVEIVSAAAERFGVPVPWAATTDPL